MPVSIFHSSCLPGAFEVVADKSINGIQLVLQLPERR
jgi:hypothetical protein